MPHQVIERNRLGALAKIGQGGQGVVYQTPNAKTKFAPSMVYKEYKPQIRNAIDFTALAAMPALVEDSLSYAQAERLVSVAAWPCALVEDAGTSTGFVMPAIPDKFFIPFATVKGVSTTTAEFQHLLNHPSVLVARGINIDYPQRYSLLREAAATLDFLHSNGVCVGDISPKNLLFSLAPDPAVYFIDCDAMRINGVSALQQLETPGWEVPSGEELATVYSDSYKLGLLALRLIVGDHDTSNPQHLPPNTPNLVRQIITDTLTKPPTGRPLPQAWSYVLGTAVEYAQQQQKNTAAAPPPTPTNQPPPTPIVHSRPTQIPPSRPPVATPPSQPPPPQPPPPPPPPPPWVLPLPAPQSTQRNLGALFAAITIVVVLIVAGVILLNALGNKHNSSSSTQTTSDSQPSTYSFSPTPGSTLTQTPETTTPPPPPPPPPTVWISISSAQPDGWGYATSTISADDAKAKAIAKCAEVNTGCQWNSVTAEGCVALVKANDGTIWGGHGPSEAAAEQDALNEAHGSGRVLKSICVSS
jgi:serine/threonine protein kinase